LTAIVGILVWKEKFNLKILLGLLIIIAGVVVLKLSH
ncbi:TPA: QacE family quaternary ammonium compound efflux SMR transporter, partial [Listeria monocytogenes]|nr:QacE family quaternary ammonium compound efflux SMR transporter [Listeria monocytogenes]